MKAEHRKQLQTNALADRVGKFVQTLKTKPQKRTLFYLLLAVAAVVGVVVFLNYRSRQKTDKSMLWVDFENGHPANMEKLLGHKKGGSDVDYSTMNVGKAAKFQYAHYAVWERGIKAMLASPPRTELDPKTLKEKRSKGALANVEIAKGMYLPLLEACKDDPVWGAEATYNLGVIEETLAVEDSGNTGKSGHLTKARMRFEEVIKNPNFKNSPWAKLAEKKVESLKEGSPSLKEISEFYQQLALDLRIAELKANLKQ